MGTVVSAGGVGVVQEEDEQVINGDADRLHCDRGVSVVPSKMALCDGFHRLKKLIYQMACLVCPCRQDSKGFKYVFGMLVWPHSWGEFQMFLIVHVLKGLFRGFLGVSYNSLASTRWW